MFIKLTKDLKLKFLIFRSPAIDEYEQAPDIINLYTYLHLKLFEQQKPTILPDNVEKLAQQFFMQNKLGIERLNTDKKSQFKK